MPQVRQLGAALKAEPWKVDLRAHDHCANLPVSYEGSVTLMISSCCKDYFFFFFFFFFNVLFIFERERESMSRVGAEREGDIESKAGSRL